MPETYVQHYPDAIGKPAGRVETGAKEHILDALQANVLLLGFRCLPTRGEAWVVASLLLAALPAYRITNDPSRARAPLGGWNRSNFHVDRVAVVVLYRLWAFLRLHLPRPSHPPNRRRCLPRRSLPIHSISFPLPESRFTPFPHPER